MSRPARFILSSDFPTLKNDSRGSVEALIPGSLSIPASGQAEGAVDLEVGTIGAINRGRIASSKNSNIFYTGQSIQFERTGTVGGSPAVYSVLAFMFRVGPTTLRFQVLIVNPYGSTLTTEAGDETITLVATTFIAPYE